MSNMTYTELVAKLQAWEEDDDLEFQASIDDIINLGEMRLWRDLDLGIFTSEDTTPTVQSNELLLKPVADTELVSFQSLWYDNAGVRTFLQLRSPDWIRDYQDPAAEAAPRYYCELAQDNWAVAPIPDAVYTINTRGTTRPVRLSGGNTTTWLSLHQSDLLFKACMAESEGFLKADDRIEQWKTQYVELLPIAKRETYTLLQQRYNLTPLEVPAAPTNQR
jgi:hypothetical protein